MAIDPNISLQATPTVQFDPMGSALKGLQGQQTMAQTANIEAARGGIEADSALKMRQLKAKEWAGQNMHKFLDTGPRGVKVLNIPNMMQQASEHGFGDLLPDLAKSYSESVSQQISNATNEQELAKIKYDAWKKGSEVTAQMVAGVPVAERAATLANAKKHLFDLTGEDKSGDDFPKSDDPKEIDTWVRAKKAGSFTPESEANLKITQNAQSMAQASQQLEGYSAANEQMKSDQRSKIAQRASTLIDKLPPGIGSWSNDKRVQWFLNNPAMAPVAQWIAQYNLDNPGAELNMNAPSSTLKEKARENWIFHNTQSGVHAKAAQLTGFTKPTAAGAPGSGKDQLPPRTLQETEQAATPPAGSVVMFKGTNKANVPLEKVKEAEQRGWSQ